MIKLKGYKDRKLKEVEHIYKVEDFQLSFGACEDILNAIGVDKFDEGMEALSNESKNSEFFKSFVNALPVIKDIFKDIFEGLTDDEIRRVGLDDFFSVTTEIVMYSLSRMGKSVKVPKN